MGVIAIGAYRYWPRRRPAAPPRAGGPPRSTSRRPRDTCARRQTCCSLIVGVLLVLLGLLVATGASNTLVGFERDLINAFDALPEAVARILYSSSSAIASLIPAAVGVVVAVAAAGTGCSACSSRRPCGAVAAGGAERAVVERFGQPELLAAVERPDWAARRGLHRLGLGSPAWSPSSSSARRGSAGAWRRAGLDHRGRRRRLPRRRRQRRADWTSCWPSGAGVVGGSAVLLAFGAPNKRPRGPAVVDGHGPGRRAARQLDRAGVDARSSTPYFADTEDGRALFIKVLGRDERSADLMFRIYRFLRVKDVGDRGPFTSLQRMVEHEALVALYSSDIGHPDPAAGGHHQRGRRRLPARLRAHRRRLPRPRGRRSHHRRGAAEHLAGRGA